MDGVKPHSVGLGSIPCSPARVGCIGRVRIQTQPVLSFDNGRSLGPGWMRPDVEHVGWQKVGTPRNPRIRIGLADRILD